MQSFWFPLKQNDDSSGHAGTNMQAQESSKEEECNAICQLRGVEPSAPLPLKLKAIDAEYHHLIETKQSGKADHVQGLFLWKSKQASQVGLFMGHIHAFLSEVKYNYFTYLE